MKKLFTLFLALVASVSAIYASDTKVDGIWYDFDKSNKTAIVTYRGDDYYSYSNEYSGSVVIPSSVTYNGVTYSVTSIGNSAFEDCSSLTSVTIPNSVTSIGNYAFGSSSLTSVTIPNSVTSIGDYAFNKCSSLTSVTIPNSVTSIGDWSFYGCSSLSSVTIPNSVTSIGGSAFYACTSLTSVTIPNSVTSIGDYAFWSCSSLTSVTIGNGVTSIGKEAFLGCSSLTSINVDANNSKYSSVDGVLFNKDKTTLVAYPGGKQGAYTIPNSVTSIGNSAFEDCSSLTSITIPNSVTSIGELVFSYCTSLTSITIPNSVTSIGVDAFYKCPSLTSVTIGNSVTSIGWHAFAGCDKLVDVYCYATTPPEINENSFSNYNAFLYIPCENKKAYMLDAVWGNFKYIECAASGDVETETKECVISYKNKDNEQLYEESVTLHFPVAPEIEGFTFLGWKATDDIITNTIVLQATYQANNQSTPSVVTNPTNSAQKLVRDGNVYVLVDGKTYTMQGQEVK